MNRLAELRTARVRAATAFQQKELARRLGVSRQTLAAWEQGTTEPTVSQALALARELGVTVEELFGDAGPTCSSTSQAEPDEG